MKSPTQVHRNARKLNRTLHLASDNAGKTGELAVAAGRVISHRMTLGTKALMNPAAADHAEFSRMIPEKIGAFSEAGSIWLRWSGRIADQVARYVRREMALADNAVAAVAGCRSPAGLVALQQQAATDWLERVWSQSLSLGALVMRSQGAALAPVLRTATANVHRLDR
ncbi:phasin family protein [Zavarzinia sp.]|uniref:phasin family protein n=1 Tax=Zavarzinia sp. TaxID=2027920 RepID=UPI00356A61C6